VVEGFDRAADDPFALQNEITSRITYALAKELIASGNRAADRAPRYRELAEARRLDSGDRYSSIARLTAAEDFGVPKIRALFEATYFAGLRKAGIPET
jgi:hypothetical protein